MADAVTASELVRHFGSWRDRAMAQPVYIHHHGRAKLVLASVDFMEHLVSGRAGPAGSDDGLATLLDMVDTIVILTDARLCLTGVSPAARHLLGRSDWRGKALDEVMPDELRAILLRTVNSARNAGIAERLQVRVGSRGDRRIDITVQPYDGGVCIVGHDRVSMETTAANAARSKALDEMLALLGNVAWLCINLRGYIVEASGSLERMAGLSTAGYKSVRLPTLFDIPTRVAVGDALERTIDTMTPQSVRARLTSNAGEPIAVQIAFSGELLRVSGDTVLAMIAAA